MDKRLVKFVDESQKCFLELLDELREKNQKIRDLESEIVELKYLLEVKK